jgi:hypothetical protein
MEVSGRTYVVLVEQLAAVTRQTLGRVVAAAEKDRYAIIRALDLLFTGI